MGFPSQLVAAVALTVNRFGSMRRFSATSELFERCAAPTPERGGNLLPFLFFLFIAMHHLYVKPGSGACVGDILSPEHMLLKFLLNNAFIMCHHSGKADAM